MTWLLNRLFDHQHRTDPLFAFQGTVNWMRALSILVSEGAFSHDPLRIFYGQIQRRPPNQEADTLAFKCLLMAIHNVSALQKTCELDEPYSLVRSAIIAWYYATYYGSKSMLAAATGSDPETHSKTCKVWQAEIATRNLAISPFDLYLKNLTPKNIENAINRLRNGNLNNLNVTPTNHEQAFGAAISYLKGTADYERERLEKKVVQESPIFKAHGFVNFRTIAARVIRDESLIKAHVNFLVEAFRYRGKANYRDAIYLSYGADYSDTLTAFVQDLANVARAFTLMAAHYLSCRVIQVNWRAFVDDIVANARFHLPYDLSEI